MKVADAPITILIDPARCEVSILVGGIRIAMTGEEASTIWVELGDALKTVYADEPERCPSKFVSFLLRERGDDPQTPAITDGAAVERVLEGIIAYAHRSGATAESSSGSSSLATGSNSESPRSSPSALGRAIGKLTGR